MQVLSVSNQKGGVGKTTTTLNLGAGLAALGQTVLLVDLDPQASLTLAAVGACSGASMAEVLGGSAAGTLRLEDVVRPLGGGLDLAPGDIALSAAELGMVSRLGREGLLKRALAGAGYDVCLVDCGPSLGLLTVNALAASTGLIVPTLPTAIDLRGLRLFLDSYEQVRRELNPTLTVLGVLVTQYEQRLNLHQEAMRALRAAGLPLFAAVISRSVRAAEASGSGRPILTGPLAEQYQQLSKEVFAWLKNQR